MSGEKRTRETTPLSALEEIQALIADANGGAELMIDFDALKVLERLYAAGKAAAADALAESIYRVAGARRPPRGPSKTAKPPRRKRKSCTCACQGQSRDLIDHFEGCALLEGT
jgi:hypothetical protein